VSYSSEQLQALGITEGDLTLFWYDDEHPDGPQWIAQDTHINSANRTITARINHFTPFQLSDGSSPSAAYLPSLQGWQVGLYQGDARYSYPIDVPPGPGGIKPNVTLSYNSSSSNGTGGERPKQQSGWAGRGWSLDTGYIALNRLPGASLPSRYYSIVFDGQSFDLVRGDPRVSNPQLTNPTHWDWRATNESFIRVRAEGNGNSTGDPFANPPVLGRGGFTGGTTSNPYPRYRWQVWTKGGVRYDFEEDLWQGFFNCTQGASGGENFFETYKWMLTRIEDTHGNRVNYAYSRSSASQDMCPTNWMLRRSGTIDGDIWATEITWGSNTGTGATDRYKVDFQSSARTMDTLADQAPNHVSPVPQETRRLDAIKVWSKQSSTWELVRQYNLTYESNSSLYLLSDNSLSSGCPGGAAYCPDTTYPKLTLKQIQHLGKDGTTALPATTFT
jgi:hypothetical protein